MEKIITKFPARYPSGLLLKVKKKTKTKQITPVFYWLPGKYQKNITRSLFSDTAESACDKNRTRGFSTKYYISIFRKKFCNNYCDYFAPKHLFICLFLLGLISKVAIL